MENSNRLPYDQINAYSVENPVLLIAFNRPEETASVITRLRDVKPKIIYFAVDGPRINRPEDKRAVELTRSLVSGFDWDCKVLTRFSPANLGCGLGVSSAISWALETEESVIILEDDIVPRISFFKYCDELLERYKYDQQVFAISGCSFVPTELLPIAESYRFSSIPHVWGWAVWKRSWSTYSFDISDWRKDLPVRELRKSLGGSILATFMWSRIFDLMAAKKIDTWDYQLCFAVLKSRSKVATTNVNCVTNIGFDKSATHTVHVPKYVIDANEVVFPLQHPAKSVNESVDEWVQRNVMGASFGGLARAAIKLLKKLYT